MYFDSPSSERANMKPAPPHTENGFRAIAENAPEGILVAQGFDAPFLYANRRACELSGYTLSELMGGRVSTYACNVLRAASGSGTVRCFRPFPTLNVTEPLHSPRTTS
jgi:PAS domain-containing protein